MIRKNYSPHELFYEATPINWVLKRLRGLAMNLASNYLKISARSLRMSLVNEALCYYGETYLSLKKYQKALITYQK
jgi:hypothetical protein